MSKLSAIIISVLALYSLYTDLKRREIDDWVSIVGSLFAIFITITGHNNISVKESLISGIVAFVIFYIFPIGGGDMKFLTFIGFAMGLKKVLIVFALSCIFASILSIGYVIKNVINVYKLDKNLNKKAKLGAVLKVEIPFMIGIAPAVICVLWFSKTQYMQNVYFIFNIFLDNIKYLCFSYI